AAYMDQQNGGNGIRDIPRGTFLAFCDEVERLDDDQLLRRVWLAGVGGGKVLAAVVVYRAPLSGAAAAPLVVSDASLRAGVLLDLIEPVGRQAADEFNGQVLASAEAVGHRFRFDRAHGLHVAKLATRLFDELREEHGLSDRERLLLQTASLL